jgi:hypothetical protein
MDVELDAVRAEFSRLSERLDGILHGVPRGTPVGDNEGVA